jgi:integrase
VAREIGKLTAVSVKALKKPGLYGDGGGLYLQVADGGSKAWIFRFMQHGKRRDMGLGPLHTVTLAEAREAARRCRQQVLAGEDPIAARRAERAAKAEPAAAINTFQKCAAAYIAQHEHGWKNKKHAAQWTATLKRYAYPNIGQLDVAAIDVGLVMQVLQPIWATKNETASRLRGRIEIILDAATVLGHRTGPNPARWKGNLDKLLPARAKGEHHPALPFNEMPAFMTALAAQEGLGARAMAFTILTGCRTTEALAATWAEIDLDAAVWTIPASRMKGKREHRVPLSEPAMAVLREMLAVRTGDYVFPGRNGNPLSTMAMLMVLRRMGRTDITVHGFRSSFRDWVAEATAHPAEVAEMALAHAVGTKTEAAYRRGDLFQKRVDLMTDWAAYCAQI